MAILESFIKFQFGGIKKHEQVRRFVELDKRKQHRQLEADLCGDRENRRFTDRSFFPDIQKRTVGLRVQGRENIPERANGDF